MAKYRVQRKQLVDQLDALVSRAEGDDRALTEEENEQFTAIQGRITRLDTLEDAQTPRGTLRAIGGGAPAIHDSSAEHNKYSLLRAIQYMLRPHAANAGLEVEVARELERLSPSQQFKGMAVPANMLLGVTKAPPGIGASPPSGLTTTSTPNQLDPLTAIGSLDNLFQRTDSAIIPTDPLASLGMQTVTGLTEREHDIPTMGAGLTAAHTLIDTALPSSGDPAFVNRPLTPKLCGSLCTLLLSSIFARHPVADEAWFSTELQNAVFAELTRVRIAGNSSTKPEEPNGLINAATANANTLVADSTAIASALAVKTALATYLKQDVRGVASWLLPAALADVLKKTPLMTGATATSGAILPMAAGSFGDLPYTETTQLTDTAFLGVWSECIAGFWMAADVLVNPYGPTDFARGSVQLRVMLLHDFLIRDVKRVLKAAVDMTP